VNAILVAVVGPYSQAVFNKARADFHDEAAKKGVDPSIVYAKKKEVVFNYRGWKLKSWALSPDDHFNLSEEALKRGLAVDAETLQPMWAENDLLGARAKPAHAMPMALVRKAISSRKSMTDQLSVEDATSSSITDTMKKHSKFAATTDRFWRVEEALWKLLTGEGVTQKVHKFILDTFDSTVANPVTEQLVILRLEQLKTTPLLVFSGTQLQSLVATVKSWVDTLLMGRCPDFKKVSSSSTFVLQVQKN
jgi:hypothetical protein